MAEMSMPTKFILNGAFKSYCRQSPFTKHISISF